VGGSEQGEAGRVRKAGEGRGWAQGVLTMRHETAYGVAAQQQGSHGRACTALTGACNGSTWGLCKGGASLNRSRSQAPTQVAPQVFSEQIVIRAGPACRNPL
jgi:hypothetical protein